MNIRTYICQTVTVISLFSTSYCSDKSLAQTSIIKSPDTRLVVNLRMPPRNTSETPRWTLSFGGKSILSDCRLSLEVAGAGDLLAGAQLRKVRSRTADQRVRILFGKADSTRDRYQESRFSLENAKHWQIEVVLRCYDDAIAIRYEVPKQKGIDKIIITDEGTSFNLAGSPTAYVQYLENYRTSHEHNVSTASLRDIKSNVLLDMPATFTWPDGSCVAITEAALRNYSGMSLMRPDTAPNETNLVCRLTPRPDGTKVVRPLPMQTPWRVVMAARRPAALLESNTIYCLNEPSVIGNTSWIKPGKITFYWWNGNVYDGKPGLPILSLEMQKKYIDFCARSGIPTHSVIADESVTPWYFQSNSGVVPGPDTDVTRVRADLDLAGIRKYAESKNIRLWTWVHQGALRGRVDEAFAAFEKLGWSGMMVDFFDHDDQETIEFAEDILRAAARHHIMIHLHGVWKPTGWHRTYPNLMNHEGSLNLEYLKWSDRCTPEHNLMLSFTRLIAGPMDYHLGGFRAVTRAAFKPQNIAPNVLGTRCHHLAMYVCFDNPNPMIADYPTAYEGQPGFDFLMRVPTWWDETRVLVGDIGKTLVTARRKGRTWYIGGMTAVSANDISLPLEFLDYGRYSANIWKDASESGTYPNHLQTDTLEVTKADKLLVHTAIDGGFVVVLTPKVSQRVPPVR